MPSFLKVMAYGDNLRGLTNLFLKSKDPSVAHVRELVLRSTQQNCERRGLGYADYGRLLDCVAVISFLSFP